MERSMHFISLIQKALLETDPQKALTDAIDEIMALRNNPEHAGEFAMFSSFMAEVFETWRIQEQLSIEAAKDIIEDITLQLTADTVMESMVDNVVMQGIDWPPGFIDHLGKRIRTLLPGDDIEHPEAELDVFRNGRTVSTIKLELTDASHYIKDVRPGDYAFSLGTGRLLWEVTLEEKDLYLTEDSPGKNIPLAAGTGEERRPAASRVMSVLGGEIVIRIFPGLESGWIEIQERVPR